MHTGRTEEKKEGKLSNEKRNVPAVYQRTTMHGKAEEDD